MLLQPEQTAPPSAVKSHSGVGLAQYLLSLQYPQFPSSKHTYGVEQFSLVWQLSQVGFGVASGLQYLVESKQSSF